MMLDQTMRVKPILMYELFQRKEQATWRNWADIANENDVEKEKKKIQEDLKNLQNSVAFPLEFMELGCVQYDGNVPGWVPERKDLDKVFYEFDPDLQKADAVLIFGASGGRWSSDLLEALLSYDKPAILFLRYKSGHLSLPYEMISAWLRKFTDELQYKTFGPDDIVVDDMKEVAKKLTAIYGITNTKGRTVVSLGYPSGMDRIDFTTLPLIRRKWGINLKNVSYRMLGERLKEKRADSAYMSVVEKDADAYLKQAHVTLKTKKEFIPRNFLLKHVISDYMNENDTYAFAIGQCMSGILPIAETTACMTLGLLNDDGYVATCEGDFVCVPAQMMLHNICCKPTFLVDPTWANNGMVSLAHCAGTSKLDGKKYDKVDVVTHYESDYGAAVRAHLEVGRRVTVIIPDFSVEKYIVFNGNVLETPEANMCRSHVDISIDGDYKKLNRITRGFHWVLCYDDYKEEVIYALNKIGIQALTI